MSLFTYQEDGANRQARAVLAYLQGNSGIEKSWDGDKGKYMAEPQVARWENCREQGYVVYMRSKHYGKQINIAFFEHRNSDGICAVKWEQVTLNSPTIDTAEFGNIYKDKYDTSFDVGYGKVVEMSDWIYEQLEEWWLENLEK